MGFLKIQLRHRTAVHIRRDHQAGSGGGTGSALFRQRHAHRSEQGHAVLVFRVALLRHVLHMKVGGRIGQLLPQHHNHLPPGGKLPLLRGRGDPRASRRNRRELPELVGCHHRRVAALIPDAPVVRVSRKDGRGGESRLPPRRAAKSAAPSPYECR